jgi:hypothetical protein
MEDITITFDDDMRALSSVVYINRKGFGDYADDRYCTMGQHT